MIRAGAAVRLAFFQGRQVGMYLKVQRFDAKKVQQGFSVYEGERIHVETGRVTVEDAASGSVSVEMNATDRFYLMNHHGDTLDRWVGDWSKNGAVD
jgi:hypothetical protein